MRRIMSVAILLAISISLFAQKDVTKFMGIPVDGTKPAMIQKLKQKGFVSSNFDKDILQGEFNGAKVNLYVATNNNKVCRIMLCDATYTDEADIRIRFNRLCEQFKDNSNYWSYDANTIDDKERISYGLTVHNKRYEAIFLQKPLGIDTLDSDTAKERAIKKPVWFMISKTDYPGKFYIAMFYDNEYNRSNGEDL